jgi:hypothetical protein
MGVISENESAALYQLSGDGSRLHAVWKREEVRVYPDITPTSPYYLQLSYDYTHNDVLLAILLWDR